MALPEFLLGTPYEQYKNEGSLVMAYSMAILQELNGRNVNNPISCLRGEAYYSVAPSRRADIRMDLDSVGVLNDAMRRYCIKRHNWLEAKFFRSEDGEPVLDGTKAVHYILKDLIRLSAFPDETEDGSTSSRYLLHAYEGDPSGLVSNRRNKKEGVTQGFDRKWLTSLRAAGTQEVDDFHLGEETGQFDTIVGEKLRSIDLSLTVTNFCYEPCNGDDDDYYLYLTRLDSIELEFDGKKVEINGSLMTEHSENAYESVGKSIDDAMAT